jgi:hypothetical protein
MFIFLIYTEKIYIYLDYPNCEEIPTVFFEIVKRLGVKIPERIVELDDLNTIEDFYSHLKNLKGTQIRSYKNKILNNFSNVMRNDECFIQDFVTKFSNYYDRLEFEVPEMRILKELIKNIKTSSEKEY